jgi:glycosyltransferase involved in cell wall biosynthesis
MRILLVHNKYKQPGGEDYVFHRESELLSAHGHEVDHLIFDNASIRNSFDRLLSGIRTIYNPASARTLRKKIYEFRPDVIHVHNFLPLASPSIFFEARRQGVPVGITLHNYRLICPSATLFHNGGIYEASLHVLFPWDAVKKGVYRHSVLQTAAVALMTAVHNLIGTWRNRVDFYVALTQFSKAKFIESCLSIPAQKIVVKPNFVSDVGGNDAERSDFFLYIGRLTEEKGIAILLKAARLYSFRLVIAGDGPLRNVVEEAASKNQNISFVGQQGKEQVATLLRSCRALIFPSIWYEGFPITILEAFAASTAVIASRMGSMEEIIEDNANGLHFDPGDERDLVARIVEIHSFPEIGRRLGRNARKTYLNKYTAERNYGQLINIYQTAITSKVRENANVGIGATRLNNAL